MTDMSNWNDEERDAYIRILRRMAMGNIPDAEELLALPTVCKEAMVEVYKDKLYPKPPSMWQKLKHFRK